MLIHVYIAKMMLYRLINLIILSIVNGFFTIAGIFLNSVVVIIAWTSKSFRKGTSNFMILILSSFDLLVGIFGHPSIILSVVPWSTRDNSSAHWSTAESNKYSLTEIGIIVLNYTQSFSMIALLVMTIDRYLALTRPLFHKIHVTRRRLLSLTVALQFLLIGVRMLRFFGSHKAIYYAAAFLIATMIMLLLAYMNYGMFRIAAKAKPNKQAPKMQLVQMNKNCTCVLAVICFYVCVIPIAVYAMLRLLTDPSIVDEDTLMLIRLWGNTSLSVSSTLNCIIFFWRNEILRKEGKKLLSRCHKR